MAAPGRGGRDIVRRNGRGFKFGFVVGFSAKPFWVLFWVLLGFVVWFCFRWHPRDVLPGSGVAPVRGGTYFLCRRKESKQRKRANTARS
ncbi:hypothetical protein [Burkholderia sp. Ac-20365]|uniref:hypothetical protein n=1 Tax=Burkholderia sp. Ac-20365 TaxID=2703897 RepID=UPI00197C62B6|nr:hypothetical protein [Burkholderia sp. Ac-20365]MBN3765746.1 hypothetical protein [Burkholderia sp. Ac-20365]